MVGAHEWWSLPFKGQTTGLIYPQKRSQDLAQISKELKCLQQGRLNTIPYSKIKLKYEKKIFFLRSGNNFTYFNTSLLSLHGALSAN